MDWFEKLPPWARLLIVLIILVLFALGLQHLGPIANFE